MEKKSESSQTITFNIDSLTKKSLKILAIKNNFKTLSHMLRYICHALVENPKVMDVIKVGDNECQKNKEDQI